jgi:hypothetical protein
MPRYTSPWKRLDDALVEAIKAGLSETNAKQDICSAITDRAIDFRVLVELEVEDDNGDPPGYRHISNQIRVEERWLASRQVKIPATLKPSDFDWEHSRPKHEWNTTFNSSIDDPYPRIGTAPEYRKIKLIELRTSDINKLFSELHKQAKKPTFQAHENQHVPGVPENDFNDCWQLPAEPPRSTQRNPTAAYRALLHKYPDGKIPKISMEKLAKIANSIIGKNGGLRLGREDIERALQRRK